MHVSLSSVQAQINSADHSYDLISEADPDINTLLIGFTQNNEFVTIKSINRNLHAPNVDVPSIDVFCKLTYYTTFPALTSFIER